MIGNYAQLVEKIAKFSSLSKEEIDRRVEAKRAKLSGLISKEGAAQVVASELGISFDKEKMKLSELLHGMKRVNAIGKIIKLFPVRGYSKNGREGKIASMIVADDTGNIRTVLWDTNHIKLIEDGKIKQDDIVEISNASVRNAELHLTGFSDIKLSNEKIENVKIEKAYSEKKILEFVQGESVKTRAIIVQMFEPRFFEICPECNKRVNITKAEGENVDVSLCQEHGKIIPVKRALISSVIDDGTGNIRVVLFNEQIEKLGINSSELENSEEFLKKRDELLGEEFYFFGNIRQNKMFNRTEFFLEDAQQINTDELIQKLEGKTE